LLLYAIPRLSASVGILYNQDKYADGYDDLAASLAHGDGYRFYPDTAPTVMREPGYPLLLAGIFKVFGNSLTAVKLINMLLALATSALLMKIAGKLSDSQVVVLGSPLLFLFHPGVLIGESRGGVETLFTFCVVLFVLLLYRAIETDRWFAYLVCGGILGVTVLVRSTLMLFPVIVFAYLCIFLRRGMISTAKNVGLMIASMLIVLSPWIIRNFQLTGKFVPTASVLGISAHSGQYVCENLTSDNSRKDVDRRGAAERRQLALELGYPFKDVKDAYYQYFYHTEDELKFSSFLLNRVVDKYKSSPTLFVSCAGSNLFDFWFAGKTKNSTKMNLVLQIPYLLLAIVGVVLSWRKHQISKVMLLVLLIVYTVAVYVPILAQARYSISVIPFVSVLVSISIAFVFELFGRNKPVLS
jgi:4-amino-4-deoxy-L-arabinose transferase-like glycosyltransferase